MNDVVIDIFARTANEKTHYNKGKQKAFHVVAPRVRMDGRLAFSRDFEDEKDSSY
jgi:hypothetical protein